LIVPEPLPVPARPLALLFDGRGRWERVARAWIEVWRICNVQLAGLVEGNPVAGPLAPRQLLVEKPL